MYCSKCGSKINDEAIICVNCGCLSTKKRIAFLGPDEKSTGLNVLCFFIWAVGLILYIVWKKDYPIKAKSCGKWALIGVCVYVGLMILYLFYVVFLLSRFLM